MRILIIIWLLFSIVDAQNLVLNPSFESLTGPIFDQYGLNSVDNWRPQNFNTALTPIVSTAFSKFSSNPNYSVPNNAFGKSTPSPHITGGSNYAMLTTFSTFSLNGRTYPGGELAISTISGVKYYWSYDVQLCENSGYSSSGLGIKMLSDVAANGFPDMMPTDYIDNIISDTGNWVRIGGQFIADSSYRYFAIGNFLFDGATDIFQVSLKSQSAFYYVDNVCLSRDSIECAWGISGTGDNHTPLPIAPTYGDHARVKLNHGEVAEVIDTKGKVVMRSENEMVRFVGLPKGVYYIRVGNRFAKFLYL